MCLGKEKEDKMQKFSFDKKGYNISEVESFIDGQKDMYEKTLFEQKTRIFELKDENAKVLKELNELRGKVELIGRTLMRAEEKASEIEKLSKLKYHEEMMQLKSFHTKWLAHYDAIMKKYPLEEDLLKLKSFDNKMTRILSDEMVDKNIKTENLSKTIDDYYMNELQRINGLTSSETSSSSEAQPLSGGKTIASSPISISPSERELEQLSFISGEQLDPDEACKLDEQLEEELIDIEMRKEIFNPLDKINRHYRNVKSSSEIDKNSSSGFSFTEALNPQQDLAEIMRDLGILADKSEQ